MSAQVASGWPSSIVCLVSSDPKSITEYVRRQGAQKLVERYFLLLFHILLSFGSVCQ
jgi:hypothetical protein